MNKVSVIGATGYVGAEITRLLCEHPLFELAVLSSKSFNGECFSDIYPSLRNIVDITLEDMDIDKICSVSDYVITALPHGVSSRIVPMLLDKNVKVLDHSGDYRYNSISDYLKAYRIDHSSPELLDEAVYGIPEIYRDRIGKARLVSNPGCYPTCSILGMAPLLSNRLINSKNIIINGASGVSGAGRTDKTEYSYSELDGSFKAYSPVGHRHTSEIEQEFSLLSGEQVTLTFTPHLVPMKRGMLCTIYADLKDPSSIPADIENAFMDAYGDEFFVRYLGYNKMPQTKAVAGSNYADISFVINPDTGKVIVFSAIDNLGKGAASQAVQCLNIMAGIDEETGLKKASLYI